MTGIWALRAESMALLICLTTESFCQAFTTTPFWTSMTSSALLSLTYSCTDLRLELPLMLLQYARRIRPKSLSDTVNIAFCYTLFSLLGQTTRDFTKR